MPAKSPNSPPVGQPELRAEIDVLRERALAARNVQPGHWAWTATRPQDTGPYVEAAHPNVILRLLKALDAKDRQIDRLKARKRTTTPPPASQSSA